MFETRLAIQSERHALSAAERRGNSFNDLKTLTRKPRPTSGLDYLAYNSRFCHCLEPFSVRKTSKTICVCGPVPLASGNTRESLAGGKGGVSSGNGAGGASSAAGSSSKDGAATTTHRGTTSSFSRPWMCTGARRNQAACSAHQRSKGRRCCTPAPARAGGCASPPLLPLGQTSDIHGLKSDTELKRCAFLMICLDSNCVRVND